MIQINRVLVPVDFSEFSDEALKYGREFCVKFAADLHLLHILEIHTSRTPSFALGLAVPKRYEESQEQAMEKLKELPGKSWPAERSVVRETAHGSPFVEIIKYAKEHTIDIIVMGTHGRTGLNHVFMGSVAENVVRQAPCPVLTIRPEGHSFVAP